VSEDEQRTEAPAVDEDRGEDRPDEGFRRQWQPRLYVRLIVVCLLIAYGIAFVLENNKHVRVHFVLGSAGVSLVWLILLSLALGVLLGILTSQLYRRRGRRH
jgi:uncharacterized integral membrane protein